MKKGYDRYVQPMLMALGELYVLTSLRYTKVALSRLLVRHMNEYPYIDIAATMIVRYGIVDRAGKSQRLKWVTGPPSLQLADDLIRAIDEQRSKYYRVARQKANACRHYEAYRMTAGVAVRTCRQCPYRDLNPCEFLREIGFDCRRYDMKTLKLERMTEHD